MDRARSNAYQLLPQTLFNNVDAFYNQLQQIASQVNNMIENGEDDVNIIYKMGEIEAAWFHYTFMYNAILNDVGKYIQFYENVIDPLLIKLLNIHEDGF